MRARDKPQNVENFYFTWHGYSDSIATHPVKGNVDAL
jgi:hypothetical protein